MSTQFLFILIFGVLSGLTLKLDFKIYKNDNVDYAGYIYSTLSNSEKVHFLVGASNIPSALSVIISKGHANSTLTVNDAKFFSNNVSKSIDTNDVYESHGLLIFNFCDFLDKQDTATFENVEQTLCKNSAVDMGWTLDDIESSKEKIVLRFKSHNWTSIDGNTHYGVEFWFTVSAQGSMGRNPVTGSLGLTMQMFFKEKLSKPYSRLGMSMLFFTNTSIHPEQNFLQTDTLSLTNEIQPGNFLSSTVCLDKRIPEMLEPETFPPAYLFWNDVCFVDPGNAGSSSSARRLLSFTADIRHHKDNKKIIRSIPEALYGHQRFNIHENRENMTMAIRHHWFGFGNPGDGFYTKTNHVDWLLVLSLGQAPVPSLSAGVSQLLGPLLMPLLALLVSVAYVFVRQRWCLRTPPTHPSDVTRPLICQEDDISEEGGSGSFPTYPSFSPEKQEEPDFVVGEEEEARIDTPPPSSVYGAI